MSTIYSAARSAQAVPEPGSAARSVMGMLLGIDTALPAPSEAPACAAESLTCRRIYVVTDFPLNTSPCR